MKIGKGVQAILNICVSSLRNNNVGIIDEGIYEVPHSYGFRWHEIHIKFYDDRFRHSDNIKVIAATI
jgi:hypothetical protein